MTGHITALVEDPGAANYIAGLTKALAERGRRLKVFAAGPATIQLRRLGEAYEIAPQAPDALLEEHPDLVAVGTSENLDSLGLALVNQSHSRGIPTAGFVDSPASPDMRFRGRTQNSFAYAPQAVLVADIPTAEALARHGLPMSRIAVCGHPLFDRVRQESTRVNQEGKPSLRRRLFNTVPTDQRILVVAAERLGGADAQQFVRSPQYTLVGRGTSPHRQHIVIEEILGAIDQVAKRPYLVLRLHPKVDPQDFHTYLGSFDAVSTDGSPWDLIGAADAVVGSTSILLAEAVLLRRPSLAVLPRECEKDWLLSIRAKATRAVTTRSEIAPALASLLEEGPPDLTEFDRLSPTNATARVARVLDDLAGGQLSTTARSSVYNGR